MDIDFIRIVGDAYTAIMVTDPEAEDEDPRGGPRVAFQIASSAIIQPAKTSSWQWGLAFVLGVLTIATAFQLGLVANVSMLPKVCIHPLQASLLSSLRRHQQQVLQSICYVEGLMRVCMTGQQG